MQFKILKKIIGILGFKLIDKNLIKNNDLLSKNLLYSLENILESLFENNKVSQLIQIGANDGKRFDAVNKFIIKYSPYSILVEPIEEYFLQLKQTYKNQKNVEFENKAISVNDQINYLYKVKDSKINQYDEHVKGITSFDKNHLKKHGVQSGHIKREEVKSISISNLINKYENRVDLLIIDAEGYDGDIVIDLLKKSNARPIIIFEYIHIKFNTFKILIDLLSEKNYLFFKINENVVCFPREKSPKLILNIS